MLFKKFSVIVISVFLLVFAVNASVNADTMTLSGVNGNNNWGYYISPYYANITGTITGTHLDVFCVDPTHWSSLNSPWTINVTQVGSSGGTYLGNSDLYKEAAYLLFYTNHSQADMANIQAAIWSIIAPGNTLLSSLVYSSAGVQYWVGQANAILLSNFAGIDFSGIYILSDVNKVNQEFLVRVPEPTTILLLGAGILGIGIFARRKNKK
jgi:hypothetical protein